MFREVLAAVCYNTQIYDIPINHAVSEICENVFILHKSYLYINVARVS